MSETSQQALYAGRCAERDDPIAVGDLIVQSPAGDWIHARCVPQVCDACHTTRSRSGECLCPDDEPSPATGTEHCSLPPHRTWISAKMALAKELGKTTSRLTQADLARIRRCDTHGRHIRPAS